jgi:putative endopeptidase
MYQMLGESENGSVKDADAIYQIEIFLADSSRKLEDLRDPYSNYNKMSISDLQKISPAVDWKGLFTNIGANDIDSLIIGQPEFYKAVSAAIHKFTINQWKAYLKWHLINAYADRLNSAFDIENFHFRGTVMSGVTEQRPRWKRVEDAVEDAMGELLGQVYVKKYYSPETKRRYEKLVDNMIKAFADRIKNLDWMGDSTKVKALYKLSKIIKKVGYPDKWKDFSKLLINRSSYARNTVNERVFWFERDINKLGKPVDRTEWNMTPQTYNAYYNPSNNEIVLPAAMFIVPGVPDSLLDDAVIYSYAGASTIGHEMTHGFDDQGRQYDEKGNLSDWWTKQDEEKFNERTKLMVEQFDNYVVLDSMHINGKATLGENIADFGGLVIGFDAFKQTDQYKEGKALNGLTPSQRFWLGYAYSWLGHIRPEAIAQQVLTDVHSPNFLRVNGPLSDIPDFYESFGIKEGQPMWRQADKRVKIW